MVSCILYFYSTVQSIDCSEKTMFNEVLRGGEVRLGMLIRLKYLDQPSS